VDHLTHIGSLSLLIQLMQYDWFHPQLFKSLKVGRNTYAGLINSCDLYIHWYRLGEEVRMWINEIATGV
jgi:hypothetical protein